MAKFVKGQIPWNKGIPVSEEVKAKISAKNTGKKHTPETQAKINLNLTEGGKKTRFKKGNKTWNTGLKYERLPKEQKEAKRKAWTDANKDKIYQTGLAWKKANPERVAEIGKKSRLKNLGRVYANNAKRRADRINRTPKWLTKDDFWMIKEAYELATLRTKLFGFSWHVDHIIPLKGKNVSGLHVITNLQVIEGMLNIMKNNKFEGELI